MVCASIQNKNAEQIKEILQHVEMAEIRLDSCNLSDEDIMDVFSSDVPLIATCRIDKSDIHTSEHRLTAAIKAGARYADLEIEAPKPMSKRIAQACAEWGTVMIRSYHDFEATPSLDELRQMVDKCRHHDGEIVKIVTTAHSSEDAERVLSLYNYYTADSLVAFAMGADGSASRVQCLAKGSPFSYSCVSEQEATAPGQMTYDAMYEKVYGPFGTIKTGEIRMPASKSYAQRAIISAAMADGISHLGGYSSCDDSEAAIGVARTLGADVKSEASADGSTLLTIEGINARVGCLAKGDINVGESGLLTRIMMPVASQLYAGGATISGRGTLMTRPLQGAGKAMAALGAEVSTSLAEVCPPSLEGSVSESVEGVAEPISEVCPPPGRGRGRGPSSDGRGRSEAEPSEMGSVTPTDLTIPLTVKGPLGAGRMTVDGSKSSQLVTGALMALPLGEKHAALSVMNPTSIPYIYMTMDILRKFGVKVRSEMYGGRALLDDDWSKCTEILLKVKEQQTYKAADFDLEGDWSAATVFLAAGAIFGQVSLAGLDTTSLQADLTMMDILMEAGASLSQLDEPKGVVTATKAPLRAFKADLTNCPDLFPVTAVFCAFCQGQSSLRGVKRLAHKESDRAAAIVELLQQAGVRVQIKGDDMTICGESLESRLLNSRLLKGGSYTSHHDHRMVMALRLAELGADAPINIDDIACVAKSYPQFNTVWDEYIRK